MDYVRYWTKRTELPAKRLPAWMQLGTSKYHQWKHRYGKANEHNAEVPRDWWLEDWEKQAILDFHERHPLDGYRSLAFQMLDHDVVAVSPSSVYRVLKVGSWQVRREVPVTQYGSRPVVTESLMSSASNMRVQLRIVEDGDLPIFFEQQLDPDANHMAAFTRKDPTDREAFMQHWAELRSDDAVMIRTIRFGKQVAGLIASFVDEQLGEPEVTYWIGKEFWGQGIATSALAQFLSVQLSRPLYARAAKDNFASLRVLHKCGFAVERYDKGYANARGGEIEEAVLKLPSQYPTRIS